VRRNKTDVIITRAAEFSPKSINEEKRSMRVIASTDIPVRRYMGGEYVNEIIPVGSWQDVKKVPLLDAHSRWSTVDVKGSAINFKKGDVFDCDIVFSSKAEDEFIKAKEGHIDSVSVGYDIREYYYVDAGETLEIFGKSYTANEIPSVIATKTVLRELSLVPIGADADAKIRGKELENSIRMNKSTQERDEEMNKRLGKLTGSRDPNGTTTVETPAAGVVPPATRQEPATVVPPTPAPAAAPTVDLNQIRAQERARVSEIQTMCRECGMTEDFTRKAVDDGLTIDTTSALIVKEMRAKAPAKNPSVVTVGTDSSDNLRTVLGIVASRALGAPITDTQKTDLAKSQFNNVRSVVTIAKAVLENAGIRTAYMSNADVYDSITRAQQGMADFTYIVAGAGTNHMISVFESQPRTVEQWTDAVDLSDFNAHNEFDITPIGVIPVVADKAVVTDATLAEYAESVQLATRGLVANISRQAFISDSFGAFNNLSTQFGIAYADTLEYAVYSKLTANGAMKDTKALFHADHNNLGNGILNSPNLSLAKIAMMKQTYGDKKIGSPARFVIVPVDLEDEARTLVYSIANVVDGKNSGVINPHNGLQVIATPQLSDTDDWYLAGAPGRTVMRAYLNGIRTPEFKVFEARGNEALGFFFRTVFDVGVGVRSPFYLYKMANAGE
jgi:hypothetical protein